MLTERYVDLMSKWIILDYYILDLAYYFTQNVTSLDIGPEFLEWFKDLILTNAGKSKRAAENPIQVPDTLQAEAASLAPSLGLTFNTNTGKLEILEDYACNDYYKAIAYAFQQAERSWMGIDMFLSVLNNPIPWGKEKPNDDQGAVDTALDLIQNIPEDYLTQAQADLMKSILNQRLTLVWGPPGSGKTHFLSVLLFLLCHAHQTSVWIALFLILECTSF